MNGPLQSWDSHYTRNRSALHYPDENLVRMLKPWKDSHPSAHRCLDLGCGSGRHLALALDTGFTDVTGTDISYNGLILSKEFSTPLVCANARALPFKDNSFDAVIAWGSLHYGRKHYLPEIISEVIRVLAPKGALFGTLRSDRDTMLKTGTHLGGNEWNTSLDDIKECIVSFYSETELTDALSPFSSNSYGIMERSPLGKRDRIISHWYYLAEK